MIQGTRRTGATETIPAGTTLSKETFSVLAVDTCIVNGRIMLPTLTLVDCEVDRCYISGLAIVHWRGSFYKGIEQHVDYFGRLDAFSKDILLTGGLNLKNEARFSLAAGDDVEQLMVIDRTKSPGGFGAITATFGGRFLGGRYLNLKISSGVGVWLEHWSSFIPEGLGSGKGKKGGGPLGGAGMLIECSDQKFGSGINCISGSTARVGGRNPDSGVRMIGGNNLVGCNHGSHFEGVIEPDCTVSYIGGAANASSICYETYIGDPTTWKDTKYWRCDANSSVIHPRDGLLAGLATPGVPTDGSEVTADDITHILALLQGVSDRVSKLETSSVPAPPQPHDTIAVVTDAGGRFQGPKRWAGKLWVDKR